ncbi:MAG: Txe/YoeB family addiction module toxin [Oscillospiraceae bacterium]|nr:Txe/YoeB family addiction module toxin [Oscillospiraceae bacterium]
MYRVVLSRQAAKDKEKIIAAGFGRRAKALLVLLAENPYRTPPPYEKLTGDLKGFCSRRINHQHRLVYEVREAEQTVVIARMWTHYE